RRALSAASRGASGSCCLPTRNSAGARGTIGDGYIRPGGSPLPLPGSCSGSFAGSQAQFPGRARWTKTLVANSGKQVGAGAAVPRPSRYPCRFEGTLRLRTACLREVIMLLDIFYIGVVVAFFVLLW